MDRPKIICHILQSVDGNIDGDFFTVPEIGSAYREFSRIREEFACDAVISGATTAAEIYRGGFIGILPQASERWPRTDRKAASAEKYAVVIDGTGSVRWESGNVERRGEKLHVIVVLQENATDACISHLRKAGVSYMIPAWWSGSPIWWKSASTSTIPAMKRRTGNILKQNEEVQHGILYPE